MKLKSGINSIMRFSAYLPCCLCLGTLVSDSLSAFPPKSVPLKRPFAVQPWLHSEENVANLLMVELFKPFFLLSFSYLFTFFFNISIHSYKFRVILTACVSCRFGDS